MNRAVSKSVELSLFRLLMYGWLKGQVKRWKILLKQRYHLWPQWLNFTFLSKFYHVLCKMGRFQQIHKISKHFPTVHWLTNLNYIRPDVNSPRNLPFKQLGLQARLRETSRLGGIARSGGQGRLTSQSGFSRDLILANFNKIQLYWLAGTHG